MRAGGGPRARRYSFLATNATISVMTVDAAWSIAAATWGASVDSTGVRKVKIWSAMIRPLPSETIQAAMST